MAFSLQQRPVNQSFLGRAGKNILGFLGSNLKRGITRGISNLNQPANTQRQQPTNQTLLGGATLLSTPSLLPQINPQVQQPQVFGPQQVAGPQLPPQQSGVQQQVFGPPASLVQQQQATQGG